MSDSDLAEGKCGSKELIEVGQPSTFCCLDISVSAQHDDRRA